MPTKSQIALQTVDVADKIHDLYQAAQDVEIARKALKAAKTAKEVNEAQKALKAAQASKALAATTLAATLVNLLVKEDVAAGITAIFSALSTIEAAGAIATSGLSATAGSLVISILGFVLNIVIVFGFAKSPPRVYWDGKVKIKFDPKTFSFGFSIKTTSYKTINGPQIQDEIFKQLKEIVDRVNFAIGQIPKRDRDYIIKYIGLPPSNEVEYILNIDAGTATKGVQDRFLEAYIREVGGLINKINELGKEICYLALARETGLDELIDLKINIWIPELAYQAEGIYRRELERLSIKLLERREYTRQIRAVWAAVLAMAAHKGCELVVKRKDWSYEYYEMYGALLKASLDRFERTPLLKYGADLYGGLDKLKKLDIGYDPRNPFPIDHYKGKIRVTKSGNRLIVVCEPYQKYVDATLQFLNYLISELPEESIDYLSKNLGTISIYIKRVGFPWTWVGGTKISYCGFGWRHACGVTRMKPINHAPWFTPELTDGLEIFNCLETDLPEQLNALMQDIIDQYAIWQKGYALEWERRVRETLLPQYREAIAPHIIAFMESYIKIPKEIPQRIAEAKYEILRKKEKEAQQITNYLPMIEQNKDWIIKTFGVDEYNRLVELARERYKKMTGREAPIIEKEALVSAKGIYYILGGFILGYLLIKR